MNIVIIVLYVYILVIKCYTLFKRSHLYVSYSFSCVSKVFYDSSIHLYYYNHITSYFYVPQKLKSVVVVTPMIHFRLCYLIIN